MPLTLTPAEVKTFTGADVTANDIAIAKQAIEDQTDYTVDEHDTARSIDQAMILTAWALVAARVHDKVTGDGDVAVIGETQGDYTISESERLAAHHRFRSLIDGTPEELLRIPRAFWSHA